MATQFTPKWTKVIQRFDCFNEESNNEIYYGRGLSFYYDEARSLNISISVDSGNLLPWQGKWGIRRLMKADLGILQTHCKVTISKTNTQVRNWVYLIFLNRLPVLMLVSKWFMNLSSRVAIRERVVPSLECSWWGAYQGIWVSCMWNIETNAWFSFLVEPKQRAVIARMFAFWPRCVYPRWADNGMDAGSKMNFTNSCTTAPIIVARLF